MYNIELQGKYDFVSSISYLQKNGFKITQDTFRKYTWKQLLGFFEEFLVFLGFSGNISKNKKLESFNSLSNDMDIEYRLDYVKRNINIILKRCYISNQTDTSKDISDISNIQKLYGLKVEKKQFMNMDFFVTDLLVGYLIEAHEKLVSFARALLSQKHIFERRDEALKKNEELKSKKNELSLKIPNNIEEHIKNTKDSIIEIEKKGIGIEYSIRSINQSINCINQDIDMYNSSIEKLKSNISQLKSKNNIQMILKEEKGHQNELLGLYSKNKRLNIFLEHFNNIYDKITTLDNIRLTLENTLNKAKSCEALYKEFLSKKNEAFFDVDNKNKEVNEMKESIKKQEQILEQKNLESEQENNKLNIDIEMKEAEIEKIKDKQKIAQSEISDLWGKIAKLMETLADIRRKNALIRKIFEKKIEQIGEYAEKVHMGFQQKTTI